MMNKIVVHSNPIEDEWKTRVTKDVNVLHLSDEAVFKGDPLARYMIDVDLSNPTHLGRLKAALPINAHLRSRVFVCDPGRRSQETQAMMLGATRILHRPLSADMITAVIASWDEEDRAESDSAEAQASKPNGVGTAAIASSRAMSVLGDLSAVALAEGVPDVAALAGTASSINSVLGATKLDVWLKLVRSHHEESFRHVLIVTALVSVVGRGMGLSGGDLDKFVLASLVHDVGIVRVPPHLLPRASRLTGEDLVAYRQHPVHGHDFLRRSGKFPDAIAEAALHHHEFLDGSGYPNGLRGAAISPLAQVICVCDQFVQRTDPGAFRRTETREAALAKLEGMAAAGKLAPAIVTALATALAAS